MNEDIHAAFKAAIEAHPDANAKTLLQSVYNFIVEEETEINRLKKENAKFAWREKAKNGVIKELTAFIDQWKPIGYDTDTDRLHMLHRAREAVKDELRP